MRGIGVQRERNEHILVNFQQICTALCHDLGTGTSYCNSIPVYSSENSVGKDARERFWDNRKANPEVHFSFYTSHLPTFPCGSRNRWWRLSQPPRLPIVDVLDSKPTHPRILQITPQGRKASPPHAVARYWRTVPHSVVWGRCILDSMLDRFNMVAGQRIPNTQSSWGCFQATLTVSKTTMGRSTSGCVAQTIGHG